MSPAASALQVPDDILHDEDLNKAIAILPANYHFEVHTRSTPPAKSITNLKFWPLLRLFRFAVDNDRPRDSSHLPTAATVDWVWPDVNLKNMLSKV